MLGEEEGKFQLSFNSIPIKFTFNFANHVVWKRKKESLAWKTFFGLNYGFGIITLQNRFVLPLSWGMAQRALKVSSLVLVLYRKREGKEISLATATEKCIEVKCEEHGNRSNPRKIVCLTCSEMVYLCNTRNSGMLPTLMNQSCLLSHC